MYRRSYLTSVAGISLFTISGCTDSSTGEDQSQTETNETNGNTSTDTPESETTENGSADDKSTSESEAENNETADNEAGDEEDDETSGEANEDADTDSYDSDENETEESSDTLTRDDLELDSSAADAEVDSQEVDTIEVSIDYDGEWNGIVGDTISSQFINGSGPESRTFSVDMLTGIGSAVVQKTDNHNSTLTLTVLGNGETITKDTTSTVSCPASISIITD